MTLAAVLFDLDGTLVDTLPICYLAFRGALEGAGAPTMTDGDIHALFGPSEEGMLQRVLPNDWERVLPAFPRVPWSSPRSAPRSRCSASAASRRRSSPANHG